MDPFTEKELIDNLKSIAVSLRNMDRKMDDMALSLREIASAEEDGENENDVEDSGIEESSEEKTSL